jgi:hypothetical protein
MRQTQAGRINAWIYLNPKITLIRLKSAMTGESARIVAFGDSGNVSCVGEKTSVRLELVVLYKQKRLKSWLCATVPYTAVDSVVPFDARINAPYG